MKRKSSKADTQATWIIIIAVVLLISPFALRSQLSSKQQLDETTLCPLEGEIFRTTVLIDKSDSWDADDVNRVYRLLSTVYKNVPNKSRLTIYGIVGGAKEKTKVKRFFDLCNPGNRDDCNAFYQNCRKIKIRFETAFSGPLMQITDELKTPGQSRYSPLLESLSQIIDDTGSVPTTVYVVSDMVENHDKFQFYKSIPLAEDMVEEYPLSRHDDLSVQVHYIQRSRHTREFEAAVINAWDKYFKQQEVNAIFDRLFITD